jgi:ADP-ribose pyrophosphatase YjhB (NUDIX family)
MACGTIHYENPKIVVGCIVEQDDSILLCKRSIAPHSGLWTLPAGYMENDESTDQGALRETMEESGALVDLIGPYRIFDLPHINQVYFIFRSRLISCPFLPTDESAEVRLFPVAAIPWSEIAFAVITATLRHYETDRTKGSYPFTQQVLSPEGFPNPMNRNRR